MNCAGCGRENRAGAKFCGGCGRPLAPRCPSCGSENQPGSQFCDACGASLVAAQAGAAEARKVVTIVFADLIGSTALHERLDAESARRLMDRYHRSMGAVVEAHGGTVMQLLGDGVLAGFGVPRVAEDDAIRAVRAAVGMQEAFRELVREQSELAGDIGLRVAVNTGEVVAGDDHTHVMGDPVNVAARLQQEARDGDVLLGESTQRLVAEKVTLARFGSFALKGRAEPVAAYRVASLERPAGAAAIAFVGREDELRRIRAVYDTAVATPAARLAVLLGSPGLGKSRLIDEFNRRLGAGVTVLMAHCDAAGGATFAPLAEALRGLLRIDDGTGGDALRAAILSALPEGEPERARIADGVAALVAGTPASPEEIFFVVRRGLAALATQRPVVLAIDDIQWAEPLLHDLIEHLVQWGSDVPLLVLAAARPELRDMRSSLATPGGLVSDVVTLAGLDAGAATKLAANVIGAEALPAAIAGRVLATSEGNPLFVGELVRMLVHDGALRREGERWTAGVEVAGLEMPPTIHALLAARIERLRPEERTVLERAAVIGRHFSRTALAQLLPREITDLDARLESLRRSELVEPDTGWFLGEPVLRFHHVLIRDAAYRRLLKNTRAELHGRFADWLEARAAGSVEHDETLGWHLEQAHQHLSELGPIDAQGRALGERAARHLAAAGRRALARDDLTPAASLLERALARLDAADPARADLTLDWCEAVLSAGDVGTAVRAIAELGRFTADSDRLRAWHTCFGGQLAVFTDPKALRASAEAVEAAAMTLASAGDAGGEAKAHSVHALVLAQLGKIGACEAALDKALAAARRAKDRRRANAVLAGAPVAALWGPSPVTRASGRCLDVVRVLRITQGAPAVEAVALSCQAVLETLRGRAEAARRMIASSRKMVEELGITQRVLEADLFAGLIELLEGDAPAAERWLRTAYDGLRAQGLGIDAAQAAALLGRALLAQGRVAEAEAISAESESLAGDSFKAAIAWRGVRAEALAARGEHAAAIEFARAAVEIAAATDDLLDHADARQALAVALRAAGRSAEAEAEKKRAIELWEAKGATLLVERARRGATLSLDSPRMPEPSAVPAQAAPRRVRANAATANAARLDAAVAAGDAGAFEALLSDRVESVDHTLGLDYDREGTLRIWRSVLSNRNTKFRSEPLATLGESLGLFGVSISASGSVVSEIEVGAVAWENVVLAEVDPEGRRWRAEVFPRTRLGDAIARLFERYAEFLPDGPERTRTAATARSVAAMSHSYDMESIAAALAPDVEYVDGRSVRVLGSARGAESYLRGLGSLFKVSVDVGLRVDDVLALQSNVLLMRMTQSGAARTGGGAFERQFLRLLVFATNGLVRRSEEFDADRDAEALARFDELATAAAPSRPIRRRVRPNAATANVARVDAAIAARDEDALNAVFADGSEGVDHTTGTTWDQHGMLATWRALLRSREPSAWHEPLGTLGDSLALCRVSTSASGFSGRTFDVGAFEREEAVLIDVDAQGRRRRTEGFAVDNLGAAVARLYERYAELFPDSPERTRAAATARSIAVLLGPVDPERGATVIAPAIEFTDHRSVGLLGFVRGSETLVRGMRTLLEIAEGVTNRIDDVLALRSDAVLLRWTNLGTARASGGDFERQYLQLFVFGSDGLVTRMEWFDADGDAEALARFDELTATRALPARRVRPNAASANAARAEAAIAARDAGAWDSLFADEMEGVIHPSGARYDRQGVLGDWRSLMKARDGTYRIESLATLGASLALSRLSVSASGIHGRVFDVGPYERQDLMLIEVGADSRRRRSEIFGADHLADAVARLYERYAELLPDGPERTCAAATARSVAMMLGPYDSGAYARAHAPDIAYCDHRAHGVGLLTGVEAVRRWFGSLLEVAEGVANRIDDVVGIRADAMLLRWTNFGVERAGGGSFERHFLWLGVFGTDGLLTRLELFEGDRDAEALARFDELAAAAAPAHRRVRPNAATGTLARTDAAFAARDADALSSLLADRVEVVDHTTGATYDRSGLLATQRSLLGAGDPSYRHQPLATLGDALALSRGSTSASGFQGARFDVGPYEREEIILLEADSHGRRRRSEIFASDRLGDAIGRLYERYAELCPDGPERTRAVATARSVAASLLAGTRVDLERLRPVLASDLVHVDGRMAGLGTTRGAESFLRGIDALLQLSQDFALRIDEILDLRSDATLVRVTTSGTDRASGGAFERPFLVLLAFGPDGLVSRWEQFGVDRDAEALARFDELTTEPPASTGRFENAVTRAEDALQRAWEARDWEAFAALFPPHFRSIDRRPLMHLEASRDELLAGLRPFFGGGVQRSAELLATRGERLALHRMRLRGSDGDTGPSEVEYLQVIETDAHGERIAGIAFGPDDLDGAYDELEERFLAGEGAPHLGMLATGFRMLRLLSERHWDQVTSLFSEDFLFVDHRPLGWGTRSRDEFVAQMRTMIELAPDARARNYHVLALDRRGILSVAAWVGSREGGSFEIPSVSVMMHGPDGRIRRLHSYAVDELEAARACFDKLTAEPPPARIENAATRQADRVTEAWAARDWKRLTELFPPGSRLVDRKRTTQMGELDRGQHLEWMRPLFEMSSSRLVQVMLATRGDRLALARHRVEVADHDIGPSELESLLIIEVDEHGERVAAVRFDVDNLEAAWTELDALYAAGEAAPHASVTAGMQEFKRAFSERDWAGVAARCAPDIVVHDRRLLGWETLHGPGAYVEALRQLVDLAPDTRLRIDHTEICANGYLVITVWEGTREGGAYEAPSLMVAELDGQGRIRRFDQYDLERLDQARTRFAELRPDPLRIPPNAATRAKDRYQEAFEAGDWEALGNLCASAFVFEDRRRAALTTGDRETFVTSTRIIASAGTRMSRALLATAGDRLALEHVFWEATDGAAFEAETLSLWEIDAEGRIVAAISFDADDRRAAAAELLARDPHSDAVKRAMSDHDLGELRAALPDDFVLNDHRRTGLGQLGKDDYIASLAALFEQAPDVILEPLYTVAAEEHANLSVVPMFGTLVDGGAFESVMLRLASLRGGQIVGLELFEPEDLDAARARFEELRPDPLRIPPNAATRAGDRWLECIAAEDWDALRALCAPIEFEDRRRLNRTTGACDMVVANSQVIAELAGRASRTLLATSGDRLALERVLWTADDQGAASEVETLQIMEVDAEGRVVATIVFDPDDRRAASAELLERDPHPDAIKRAMNDHDLNLLRAALPADFDYDDHRRTGLGKLGSADDYIAALAVLFEQAPDVIMETLYTVAAGKHGNLSNVRRFGTLAEGGAFESVFVRLVSFRGERIVGLELFEPEDLDAARARFEALRS